MERLYPIACYAGRTKDAEVLKASSSGGVFTELARVVFSMGGVVIGATWVRDARGFRVVHRMAEDEKELCLLRGSKYVVSDMSEIWSILKLNLGNGRKVLFTGTPCQTAAVRKVFGENPNLILVALICHANVASDIWAKYVVEVERKAQSKLINVKMRDKRCGWKNPTMCLEYEDASKNHTVDLYRSSYGRAFSSCISVRNCCLNCRFRAGGSGADLVIGDLWGAACILPLMNDGLGVSAILVNTKRGAVFFNQASLDLRVVKYEQIVEFNPRLESSPNPDMIKRANFYAHIGLYGFSRALRIAEVGRKAELKEHYYSSHPSLVNSLPMRWIRAVRRRFFG